jgi:hypothetical protein
LDFGAADDVPYGDNAEPHPAKPPSPSRKTWERVDKPY